MVGIAKFQASKTSSEPRVKSKSSSPEESILGKIQIQTIQTLNKSTNRWLKPGSSNKQNVLSVYIYKMYSN
jgi:hypothetical protein